MAEKVKTIETVHSECLAPFYLDLLEMAFPNPDFSTGLAAIKVPSTDEEKRSLEAMVVFLKEKFAGLKTQEEKAAYLGLTFIQPGSYTRGTDSPTPDRRAGARYQNSPAHKNEVPYGFFIGQTVVPNIVYELAAHDMGGFQMRTATSPTHLHPAINSTQGNAVTALNWLSKISGLSLRLPTEQEWELTASTVSGGTEYIHGQAKEVGKTHTFDAGDYQTHLVHDGLYPKGPNGVLMGGNVWEMTTPSLETDFIRFPSDDQMIWGGTVYHAKGGGFQHCSYAPRIAELMTVDVITRASSLGFRMAASESRESNPFGGWREKTRSFNGEVLHANKFEVSDSSLHFVQSLNTKGLSFLVNGSRLAVDVHNAIEVERPHRSTELANDLTKVSQIEHVLGALAGLNIWNAMAIIDGASAPPVGDYSFLEFVKMLQEKDFFAGPSKFLEITERLVFEKDGSTCVIEPGEANFHVTIDFASNPLIGVQEASFDPNRDDFVQEIAPARTFIRSEVDEEAWEDIRKLALANLPPFAEIANSPILVAANGAWASALRFANEPARHKLGDLIGDLALLNMPIQAKIDVTKPGHEFNVFVAKELQKMIDAGDSRLKVVDITNS